MVFESYRDNQYEIYAADGDGNGAVRLTNSGANRFPKLRYGAITAGFTHGSSGSRDLWSVRKDGSALTQISSAQGYSDVAWSPDGTKMAYARRGTPTDVYVASFDFAGNALSGEVCLTCGSGRNNFEPSWSPDGKQLVFVKASATEAKGALWRMNADGSGQQQVLSEQWWIENVRWSPDGAQVAFDYATSRDDWQRVGALTLASGNLREVYNPNQDKVDVWMGSWSPDSQMLFFTRVEFVEQGGQLYIDKTWIERVNATGSGRVRLPGNSGLDAMPSVQKRDLIAPVSQVKRLPLLTTTTSLLAAQIISSDVGGSGLDKVMMYSKVGLGGPWEFYNGIPLVGTTYYFASLAQDLEGNFEVLPIGLEADTFTTFYTFKLVGRVTDNRGRAIRNAMVSIRPTPVQSTMSDLDGNYDAFLSGNTNTAVVNGPPFVSSLETLLEPILNIRLNAYLFASDNKVTNGSFEGNSALMGWQTSPNVSVSSLHYLGKQGVLLSPNLAQTETVAGTAISQVVTVTGDMHRPTLSFAYALGAKTQVRNLVSAANGAAPAFEVIVSNGITTTQVFSSNQRPEWTTAWVDMSAWQGESVTLTFLLNPGSVPLNLDDISLGSWLTPVPAQTNITQLPANAPAQQITITGTNFIATPTLKLNNSNTNITLSNVRRLTETQLTADQPANLPIGIYDLWVTNPGGQESVLPNAIKVGQQLYLPLARKDE